MRPPSAVGLVRMCSGGTISLESKPSGFGISRLVALRAQSVCHKPWHDAAASPLSFYWFGERLAVKLGPSHFNRTMPQFPQQ